MCTAFASKEQNRAASPRLELDDLLLQCKCAASRTPINNTLGRSNGHSRSLLESRNSMYNSIKPLMSKIIDEPNPSLAFTHRICTSDSTFPIQSSISGTGIHEDRSHITSSTVSQKSSTVACIASSLPEGFASNDMELMVSSPIQMKVPRKQSPSLQGSSPLVLTKPLTYSVSSQLRRQKTPGPTISVVNCCEGSTKQLDSTLRLSSFSLSTRTISSGIRQSLPGLSESNSFALFYALQILICQHHAEIIKARIDPQGYYLLVLNSSHSLLGLVQKLSSGVLAKVWGKAFDFDKFSTCARGKTLCDRLIKSYMVLRDNVIYLENAPVQYTDKTVGIVI